MVLSSQCHNVPPVRIWCLSVALVSQCVSGASVSLVRLWCMCVSLVSLVPQYLWCVSGVPVRFWCLCVSLVSLVSQYLWCVSPIGVMWSIVAGTRHLRSESFSRWHLLLVVITCCC